MNRRRPPLIGLALAMLFSMLIGPALADHGGRPIGSFSRCNRPVTPPRCSSVGDNLVHHVHFDETLTDGLATALRETMATDYDARTKLVMIVDDEVTPQTDVIAYSEDYGENGAAGWVACPLDAPQGINRSGHRWCRGQELFFNLNPRYAAYVNDDGSRAYIACHELGHTLGLRHWGNPPESAGPQAETCMQADVPNGPTDLHQIDVDHINAYLYSTGEITPPMRRFTLLALGSGTGVMATEAEQAGSLAEMTASADAVVVGRVASVAPGRSFGTAHPLHYAALTIEVGEIVAGALPATDIERLTLEIPLFDGPESMGDMATSAGLELLLFLRHKTDGPFYRLTTFGAMIANDDGLAAVTDEPGALAALAGLPFGAIVDRVAAGR